MPKREIDQFERNLQRARDIGATAAALGDMVTGALDVSDMFRAGYMQGVSAFDFFMHDEIRTRMVMQHSQPSATWTTSFKAFKLPAAGLHLASGPNVFDSEFWFESEIRTQHQHLSFQNPDKIAEACRLVSPLDIWSVIAVALGTSAEGKLPANKVAKKNWQLIIDRRNLIVHEADMRAQPPRDSQYPIDRAMLDGALDHIGEVARIIYRSLSVSLP
ncbi:hypothetical protein NYS48_00380 [Curtobacterium flaccumfaciens pv. flaccumfaciens]|uniref:hypothetical protein n=1 Tax=Curtobacterium poinsettiae TaxID=159612 RepID=UPI00217CDA53|nr:hypothetical protein [Curtobacterium flaccumfaciens]MCS6563762.1 hypothetical protein [Curtobacterium flaccumfaciens pv. flaccumfaciens]